MEESSDNEPQDCKKPMLSKVGKEELIIGDEVQKEEPYQDEFEVKMEVFVEEGILEGAQDCGLTLSKNNRHSDGNYEYKMEPKFFYQKKAAFENIALSIKPS